MKKEISESVTFSGQEAKTINWDALEKVIGLLPTRSNEPVLRNISHNISDEMLEYIFGKKTEGNTQSLLFGIPVYMRKWVPSGEVWFQDKDGKVIKKFSIKDNS